MAAISNEIYVVNEESIVMISLLSVFWAVAHYGGPMYKQWAEGHNNKIRDILNGARSEHTDAVKKRIESVKGLGGVVDITKNLFAVSKVRLGAGVGSVRDGMALMILLGNRRARGAGI